MEMPNRRFPTPPPFVYHPEIFPQLSQTNPEPANFVFKAQKFNPPRDPIKAHVVESTAFKIPKSMTP